MVVEIKHFGHFQPISALASLCDLFLPWYAGVANFDVEIFATGPLFPASTDGAWPAITHVFMIGSILFFVFAVVAIAGALGMLISRNPVNSALWLILNLFCIAGLYLTLNATFISVVQILVYAGAIMVLFIFVIMLLNLAEIPKPRTVDWRRVLAFVVAMGFLAQLAYVTAVALDALPDPVSFAAAGKSGSATVLAQALFTEYALLLEIIGILLLVATIGAVMLAKRRFA